jgi:transcription elongation GreA/GreB family factor
MPSVNKAALIAGALAILVRDIEVMRASAKATRDGAVHEESRAENDKDTRGLEASYLARGQAMRVEEMEEAASRLRTLELRTFSATDRIEIGALVCVSVAAEDEEGEHLYFLTPAAGGMRIAVDGVEALFVTPGSPVGRALFDRVAGDAFELKLGGRVREYEILDVT